MDSVPPPPERRPLGVTTALAALVLLSFVVFTAWLHHTASPAEEVEDPARALALVVGRSLDLDEAITRAPAWERALYTTLLGGRADDLAQAREWYAELEALAPDPGVDLRAAILEGEAGRLAGLRRRVDEWSRRDGAFPRMAEWLGAAYLGAPPPAAAAGALARELADALGPGWFHDRLVLALAAHGRADAGAGAAAAALAGRGARLLDRLRASAAVDAALFLLGVVALARWARGRRPRAARGPGGPPPPWSGREGAELLVRGGALAALILTAFYVVPSGDREVPRLVFATAANFAFLPAILLARRDLLRPAGLGLRAAFGLAPSRRELGALVTVLLALVALGLAGDWVLGVAAHGLDVGSHWSEWFDADLAWGDRATVAVTLVNVVVLPPVLEELLFRGLLYATLRRGLRPPAAAVVSGAVFALAHGYGAVGFASVFWSALLWAWAYEATGSLWPGIAAHAVDNLSASLAVLLMLRG